MGTIPWIFVLVSTCLTLASAEKNSTRYDLDMAEIFGPPLSTNISGSNPGNNSDNTTVFGSSLPATTPTIATENKKGSQDTNCECVPYYQCQNGTISTTGEHLINFSAGGYQQCVHYLEVCCQLPNIIRSEDVVSPKYTPRGCGVRNSNGVGNRITGNIDNEVLFGEFPWMVAIGIPRINTTKLAFQCGGSLIHKQAVLTAAHCVEGKKPHELRIRAGEWDTHTRNEYFLHQDRNVKSVIVHEKFHTGALFDDFAILILSEPVELAEHVDIVCLPEKDVVFDRSRCIATGWGKDKFNAEGQFQVILKNVDLPIIPHDTCQSSLRNTKLGKNFALHDSFICAGGEFGKDTCKGDGGGPLVCPSKKDPTRYQQAGIVAWGIGCGEDGIPGVYANVAYARDWIDKQMAFNNLDNTVYAL